LPRYREPCMRVGRWTGGEWPPSFAVPRTRLASYIGARPLRPHQEWELGCVSSRSDSVLCGFVSPGSRKREPEGRTYQFAWIPLEHSTQTSGSLTAYPTV